MKRPEIVARRIGREQQPIAIIDDFAPDPAALRAFAVAAAFSPARKHYPGIRTALPSRYLADQQALIATAMHAILGHAARARVLDASYSIVTVAPEALSLEQRLPHFDAIEPGRIALVHYLSPDSADGTAWFRHRATGFETLDAARAPVYFARLDNELRGGALPTSAYITDSDRLFERIHHVDARFNRAVLYRSAALHSGAIATPAALSTNPATGRLTITAFFLAAT